MVWGAGGFHGLYKQTSKKCYCRSDDNIRVRYGPFVFPTRTSTATCLSLSPDISLTPPPAVSPILSRSLNSVFSSANSNSAIQTSSVSFVSLPSVSSVTHSSNSTSHPRPSTHTSHRSGSSSASGSLADQAILRAAETLGNR